MRTRTFYTTVSLMTLCLLSGCASTTSVASGPMTSSVALGAMESAAIFEAPIAVGSLLCLSSGDDLGHSMWIWQVALAPEREEDLVVATASE